MNNEKKNGISTPFPLQIKRKLEVVSVFMSQIPLKLHALPKHSLYTKNQYKKRVVTHLIQFHVTNGIMSLV